MAKKARIHQRDFGSTGVTSRFGQFGSLAAGSPQNTKNLNLLQSLSAFLEGWSAAILGNNSPTIEDMNSLFYLTFYQIGYLLETGIPEYSTQTSYSIGSVVQFNGVIYRSLVDDNLNNSLFDLAFWGPADSLQSHVISWNRDGSADGSTTPLLEVWPNIGPVFRFGSEDKASNKLTYAFTVPRDYQQQTPLFVKFNYFSLETSNAAVWEVVSYLIKPGEAADSLAVTQTEVSSPVNQAATAKGLQQLSVRISDTTGRIGGVFVEPSDMIVFGLKQNTGAGNTSTQDILVIDNSEVVY